MREQLGLGTWQAVLQLLKRSQAPNGAFPSFFLIGNRRIEDRNGFTTAQVLRALDGLPGEELAGIRARALDFLAHCESSQRPGAFGFYPEDERLVIGTRPIRPLSEDADDTAIYALELFRAGRLDRQAVLRIAAKVLIPRRMHWIEPPAPAWLRRGVFVTWLRASGETDIVDCCVNTNIVALFAAAGIQHLPGYSEACAMIADGVQWAAGQGPAWTETAGSSVARSAARKRFWAIAPYYPHPLELLYALENAVMCGAEALQPALNQLREMGWEEEEADERPICGDAYSKEHWVSPLLSKIRRWRSEQGL